ncbi:MAG: hypothetical protein GY703_17370 [Gammaproteobacteria bacterium]|nr:hypothetical protein [Gammaproteobacteria bacterium]
MSTERIAIASKGDTRKSSVSDQAARCPYYLVFDRSGVLLEVIVNPCSALAGPAAQKAARLLAEHEVKMIIAAQFGKRISRELEDKGICYIRLEGKVEESLERTLKRS